MRTYPPSKGSAPIDIALLRFPGVQRFAYMVLGTVRSNMVAFV